jgi:sodium/hydrogen antiporter
MFFAEWSMFFGVLLLTMMLAGAQLDRLPLSPALIYLTLGYLLGPEFANALRLDAVAHAPLLERVAVTLVSLTLRTVAASIVAHGITAQPLMRQDLLRWKPRGRG